MRNSFAFGTFAAALFALPLLTVTPAHAGISACGNIDVSAQGSCTAEVSDQCKVDCSSVNVDIACHANLEATCEGSCPKVPSVSCTGDCEASCEGSCTPGNFDCEADCKGKASASCDGQCSNDADKDKCTASCQATFAGQCHASCTGTPATCMGQCQGSCKGSCTAQTNLECQVMCQGSGYAKCQADLEGKCKVDCEDPKGALFCDGQYVDHNGTVDECIAAIKALLPTVHIDVSAQSSGSSNCDSTTSTCTAMGQASGSASCAFSPRRVNGTDLTGAFALFAALGAVCMRRRKSR
jgi:hypothetical protein